MIYHTLSLKFGYADNWAITYQSQGIKKTALNKNATTTKNLKPEP